MVKIFHNPRCSKSREALQLLNEHAGSPEVVEYLKTVPSKEELRQVVGLLRIKPIDLIRKGEAEYKEHFKGKELTDEDWLDAMVRFPKLIERPIVINGDKAAIGRPPEKVLEVL